MRLGLGVVLVVAGLALLASSRRERADVPAWTPRLAVAIGALGVSVLAASRPGMGWSVSSICFSLIAIVLIVTVLRDNLRR